MRSRLVLVSMLWALMGLVTIYFVLYRHQSLAFAMVVWCGGILTVVLYESLRDSGRLPWRSPGDTVRKSVLSEQREATP